MLKIQVKKLHKRPYLLLEALIAFALVVLCAIPLIYPHVGMLKAERQFVRTIELDHVVNLLYADVLEKLYLNKIGINDLFHNTYQVDESMLRNIGYTHSFSFVGSYKFTDKKHKPKEEGTYGLYLVELDFAFLPKELQNANEKVKEENTLKYKYEIFLVRDQRPAGGSAEQNATQKDAEDKGGSQSGTKNPAPPRGPRGEPPR